MKYIFAVALALALALLMLFSLPGNENNDNFRMETLFENMDIIDRADVVAFLQDKKYEYKLCGRGGKTILVQKGSLYKIRMELATIGLPQFNGREDIGERIFGTIDVESGEEDPCPQQQTIFHSSSTIGEKR